VIPSRIVDADADEPAKQKVELQRLHQLPLGADLSGKRVVMSNSKRLNRNLSAAPPLERKVGRKRSPRNAIALYVEDGVDDAAHRV
jgi:hypothetical protein